MAPTVEKKIAELEMGLLHLQQNIDIPEITLPIHQSVATVMKKCQEEGRKPDVADFGDKAQDATFLNALQSGVNRWIREIQKVRCLDFHAYIQGVLVSLDSDYSEVLVTLITYMLGQTVTIVFLFSIFLDV